VDALSCFHRVQLNHEFKLLVVGHVIGISDGSFGIYLCQLQDDAIEAARNEFQARYDPAGLPKVARRVGR